MRRFVGLFLAYAITLMTPAVAFSQASSQDEPGYLRIPHRFTIFFAGGIGIPMSPESYQTSWNTTVIPELGVGMVVKPWLDVNFVFSPNSYSLNELEAKRQIGFVGVSTIEGGTISTARYLGTARFIAVPNQRFNPYAELGFGYFKTTAENVISTGQPPGSTTEVTINNSMDAASGLAMLFGVGVQYSLNETWSAYSKFDWSVNKDDSFAPYNLVRPQGATPYEGEANQTVSSISVGLMIRI